MNASVLFLLGASPFLLWLLYGGKTFSWENARKGAFLQGDFSFFYLNTRHQQSQNFRPVFSEVWNIFVIPHQHLQLDVSFNLKKKKNIPLIWILASSSWGSSSLNLINIYFFCPKGWHLSWIAEIRGLICPAAMLKIQVCVHVSGFGGHMFDSYDLIIVGHWYGRSNTLAVAGFWAPIKGNFPFHPSNTVVWKKDLLLIF